MAQPLSIVITDKNGNALTITGSTIVSDAARRAAGFPLLSQPESCVLCDTNGNPLTLASSNFSAPWVRQGTIITDGYTTGAQEPQVIWEGTPKVLTNVTTNVFKMWYTSGWNAPQINYAESVDGINWTQYASNPVVANSFHSGMIKSGGTYYLYCGNLVGGLSTSLILYTSTDGVTFASQGTALSLGGVGAWDHNQLANPCVFLGIDGQWKMLYEAIGATGGWAIGLATSSSVAGPWTKVGTTPVLTSNSGAGDVSHPEVKIIGSTYYVWTHGTDPVTGSGNLPSDIYFWTTPDLTTWTFKQLVMNRTTVDEGANVPASGQVSDVRIVEANGQTYLFHDATYSQAGTGQIHIKMLRANSTIANLVTGTQVVVGTNTETTALNIDGSPTSAPALVLNNVTGDTTGHLLEFQNQKTVNSFFDYHGLFSTTMPILVNGTENFGIGAIGQVGMASTSIFGGNTSSIINFQIGGTIKGRILNTGSWATVSGGGFLWSHTTSIDGTYDTGLTRTGPAAVALGNGSASDVSGSLTLATTTLQTPNGGQWVRGQSSELLTLSTIGLTTDTVGNLLPANAIIEAVVCRVTTALTVTTNWAVGDATIAARFSAANATLVLGTTSVGIQQCDQTGTSGPKQTAAAKVRITCTGSNPGAGAIRITVFYRQFVAPTS